MASTPARCGALCTSASYLPMVGIYPVINHSRNAHQLFSVLANLASTLAIYAPLANPANSLAMHARLTYRVGKTATLFASLEKGDVVLKVPAAVTAMIPLVPRLVVATCPVGHGLVARLLTPSPSGKTLPLPDPVP